MAPEPRIIGETAASTESETGQATSGERLPFPAVPEVGGRDGPEPTRYGDWEKNGRCIDF